MGTFRSRFRHSLFQTWVHAISNLQRLELWPFQRKPNTRDLYRYGPALHTGMRCSTASQARCTGTMMC